MGFWSKLGKVGLIAGGAVATGLTAGAASPLLGAAIGAGINAGTGAVTGGKKGALLGAGLGAVGGGALSAAKGAGSAAAAAGAAGKAGAGGSMLGKVGSAAAKMGKGNIPALLAAGAGTAGAIAQGQAAGRDSEMRNTILQGQVQGDMYRQAMQAALAKNIQDAVIQRPEGIPNTSISGGVRPSAMGPEGRAAAAANYEIAMKKLQNLPATKAGKLENTLGMVGAVGKGVGQYQAATSGNQVSALLQQLLKQQQAQADSQVEGA
jgi:hypothetical protein